MAATRNRIDETAQSASAIAGRLLSVIADMEEFVSYNQAQAIDWGGVEKPENLEEDPTGHIQAMDFTREQISNAIGTFAAISGLLAQGHRGNLQLVAKP